MKLRVACFLLGVLFLPVISFGQEQRTGMPADRNSIDWFEHDANNQYKTLLLKHLQFTGPYPGYYQATVLDTNGTAFTTRNVPNWAQQGSTAAKLNDALVAQIKHLLAQLNVPSTPEVVEPQPNRLHSAFIFYNGQGFLRFNYNGANPPEVEAILEILHKEFKATSEAKTKEIKTHQKLMRDTYGDWQNRAGITTSGGGWMHGCKTTSALVVVSPGRRKTAAAGSPVPVSVYHALVFYPAGAMTGAGSGGRWSDDPVQSYVLTWTLPSSTGSFEENTSRQNFEILHHAIDATVTIGGNTYQLSRGNMFVVRIGADWVPTVTQLKEVFEDEAKPQDTLNRFKAVLKDDSSIQTLELYDHGRG
jgi:hypothetical protein